VSIRITPTGAALGARIDVDLTLPLDDATFDEVRRAFYQYEVAYFRGASLSDENQIRFSARFGELRRLKLDQLHAKHPEIFIVSNIREDGKYIGCTKPEFRYRHSWQEHDLVMWDDCSTQHKANFDYALPLRRRMHRTTVINGL